MLPTPFTVSNDKRQNRSLIQYVTPFLQNIIFQYTNPLPFETEPHILHTIPLIREHCDSYLYYIQYKTLDITPSQTPFQVIFNPVKGINSGTFYRTIHPQNITLLYKMFFAHIYKNSLNSMNTKTYHLIVLLIYKNSNAYLNISRFLILTQKFKDMVTLIIGYNEIYYK